MNDDNELMELVIIVFAIIGFVCTIDFIFG